MLSLNVCTILFGFCLLDSVLAKNVTADGEVQSSTGNSTTTTHTQASTTTTSSNDAVCSSYSSKIPGSLLRQSEEVVFSCQCTSSAPDKVCPQLNYVTGEEYVFIEERKLDLYSDTCSLEYKLKMWSRLRVSKQRVVFTCTIPTTGEVFGLLDVHIDTPAPESSRTRLSVYMILAIVIFLLLTFAFFGCLFRWQIRSRRRAQRNALYRSPFVQPQMNYPMTTGCANQSFNGDNPPTYNEATVAQNEAGGLKMKVCTEKQTIQMSGEKQPVNIDSKPGLEQIPPTLPF